jgi:hypothetical protein
MLKDTAVSHYGSQAKLVRALKDSKTPRSKGAVSMWNDLVPLVVALELERISRGKLKVNMAMYQAPRNQSTNAAA